MSTTQLKPKRPSLALFFGQKVLKFRAPKSESPRQRISSLPNPPADFAVDTTPEQNGEDANDLAPGVTGSTTGSPYENSGRWVRHDHLWLLTKTE